MSGADNRTGTASSLIGTAGCSSGCSLVSGERSSLLAPATSWARTACPLLERRGSACSPPDGEPDRVRCLKKRRRLKTIRTRGAGMPGGDAMFHPLVLRNQKRIYNWRSGCSRTLPRPRT
jgi:hypothetical protein